MEQRLLGSITQEIGIHYVRSRYALDHEKITKVLKLGQETMLSPAESSTDIKKPEKEDNENLYDNFRITHYFTQSRRLPQTIVGNLSLKLLRSECNEGNSIEQSAVALTVIPPQNNVDLDIDNEHFPGSSAIGTKEYERKIETILLKMLMKAAQETYHDVVEMWVHEDVYSSTSFVFNDEFEFESSKQSESSLMGCHPIPRRGPGRPKKIKPDGELQLDPISGSKRKKYSSSGDESYQQPREESNSKGEEELEYAEASSNTPLPLSLRFPKYRKYQIEEKLIYLKKARELNSYRGACRALGLKWSTCRYWKKFEKQEEIERERLHL